MAAGPSPANESVTTEGTGETKDPTPLQSVEKIENAWVGATAPPISTAAPAEAPEGVPMRVAQRFRPNSSRFALGRILDSLMMSAESKVDQSTEISATEFEQQTGVLGGGREGEEGGRTGGAGKWMKEAECALSMRADVNQAFGLSGKDDDVDSSDDELFHECGMLKKNEEHARESKTPVRGSSSSNSKFPEVPGVREAMEIKKSPKDFQDEQGHKVTLDDVSDLEAGCEGSVFAANPLSSVSPSVFYHRDVD